MHFEAEPTPAPVAWDILAKQQDLLVPHYLTMLSSEPSRKKPKLSGDVDKYQESSKSKELADNKRDPANATDTCGISKAMHSSSNKIATTLSTANKFTVFVIDTDSRLFATGKYTSKPEQVTAHLPGARVSYTCCTVSLAGQHRTA